MNKKLVLIIVLFIVVILAIWGFSKLTNNKEKKVEENSNIEASKDLYENENDYDYEDEDQNDSTNKTQTDKVIAVVEEPPADNSEEIMAAEAEKASSSNENKIMISSLSPEGFTGCALYKVVLYSNKEVYLQTFDGNGYNEQNMISEELIAKNAETLTLQTDDEHYGEILIQGGEAVKKDISWIAFE